MRIIILMPDNSRVVREFTDTLIFGRDESCDVFIEDSFLSKKHTAFIVKSGKLFVKDMESTNGTYLNREEVKYAEVKKGDVIQLGNTRVMKYEDVPLSESQIIKKLQSNENITLKDTGKIMLFYYKKLLKVENWHSFVWAGIVVCFCFSLYLLYNYTLQPVYAERTSDILISWFLDNLFVIPVLVAVVFALSARMPTKKMNMYKVVVAVLLLTVYFPLGWMGWYFKGSVVDGILSDRIYEKTEKKGLRSTGSILKEMEFFDIVIKNFTEGRCSDPYNCELGFASGEDYSMLPGALLKMLSASRKKYSGYCSRLKLCGEQPVNVLLEEIMQIKLVGMEVQRLYCVKGSRAFNARLKRALKKTGMSGLRDVTEFDFGIDELSSRDRCIGLCNNLLEFFRFNYTKTKIILSECFRRMAGK